MAFEAKVSERGERKIWVEPHTVNKMRYLRAAGESYCDVIVRMAGL